MNKKGVTLVELIAVVAILGIFAILVGPAVMNIREMVLTNSLDSKINQIETAAVEYASDNIMIVPSVVPADVTCNKYCIEDNGSIDPINDDGSVNNAKNACRDFVCEDQCLTVYVKTLIQKGYILGDEDDKRLLSNPFSSVYLNDSAVCITFDSANALERKIVTYVVNKENLYLGE